MHLLPAPRQFVSVAELIATIPERRLTIFAAAERGPLHPRVAVPNITHPKKKGEYADAQFQVACLKRRLVPCRPWGDCAPFDFVVVAHAKTGLALEGAQLPVAPQSSKKNRRLQPLRQSQFRSSPRFSRVQVKSDWDLNSAHYCFRTTGNTADHPTYQAADIDFLACYVVVLDLWYIIPVSEIADDQSFLYVFPNGYPEFDKLGRPIPERETKDYEAYKDRWDLL